jgi:hypothetical protein
VTVFGGFIADSVIVYFSVCIHTSFLLLLFPSTLWLSFLFSHSIAVVYVSIYCIYIRPYYIAFNSVTILRVSCVPTSEFAGYWQTGAVTQIDSLYLCRKANS